MESPHYASVRPPVGLLDLDLDRLWFWRLGTRPVALSSCERGLSGQGACLTLSLLVDDMEVSGHVEMVGCVVHAHPRLPSFCGAHLFCSQLAKYVESSLKYNHQHLPVQRFFGLTINP
jgi:hypothetical protein